MSQDNILDLYNDEDENDLNQKISSYENSVIWGTDWTTETIVSQLNRGSIDLNPKFQRRSAWSQVTKSRFIESLILGLPIPQLILAEKKDSKGSYIVIDGKQRLLTIISFFSKSNQNPDGFESFKLKGLNILTQLNGKNFEEIEQVSSNLINQLNNQTIRTTVIKNWPNEDFLFTVFHRLNTGSTKLSPQELRQALHPGRFIDYADDFSSNSDIIKGMLGLENPDNRMRDVELIIRYFCFKYFIEEYDGNLKNSFDNTVLKLNKKWDSMEEKIINDCRELEEAIKATTLIFGKRESFSKWSNQTFQNNFNRAIFDIMVYYFSVPSIRAAAIEKSSEVRERFKFLCDNNLDFLSSFEHTTKSIPNTANRFGIWGDSLNEILNINIRVPKLNKSNKFTV